MEDAEKESHGALDNVKESENGLVDKKVKPDKQKEPCFSNTDCQNSTDKIENDAGTVLEKAELSNTETESQEQSNAKNEVVEVSNTEGVRDDKTNTETGLEDQNKPKTQSEDQDNPGIKTENKDLADLQDPEKEQNPSENGKNFENPVQSETEDQKASQNVEGEKSTSQNGQQPLQLQASAIPPEKKEVVDEGQQTENEGLVKGIPDQALNKDTVDATKELKEPEIKSSPPPAVPSDEKVNVGDKTSKVIKHEPKDTSVGNKRQSATPDLPVKYSTRSAGHSGEASRNVFDEAKMPESEDGTPEEQAAFMKELENFYRERAVEFKPPKFYGQPLNCLKLWRAVIKLGGYDRVTGSKMWRQVGESFHPPKTCTTVSWTFRIFYEKSLLEYERYQRQNGDLQLPAAALPEPSSADNEGNGYQAPGSGRARRDAAARAMQGWHVQRLFGYGEVGEPIIKDKNLNNMPKRENKLKSIGSLKQKRPNEIELPVKAQRTETSKQLVTNVVDVGAPADWVKINVRETKDSFEVYALVPGLLREEVRVQSDPAGRLVITGQPEQPDNPWGITPFKKVVSLPARIDPLQTSAVVSLHGRLFVRVPFEQSNI